MGVSNGEVIVGGALELELVKNDGQDEKDRFMWV